MGGTGFDWLYLFRLEDSTVAAGSWHGAAKVLFWVVMSGLLTLALSGLS